MITADGGISQTDYCPLITCQCGFYHDGALDALLEQLTAVLVDAGDAAGGVVGVGCTAARAVELGPAVLALGAGVGVAVLELIPHGGVGDALPDVAHQVLGVADELVAGVEVAPGGDGHVPVSYTHLRAHET